MTSFTPRFGLWLEGLPVQHPLRQQPANWSHPANWSWRAFPAAWAEVLTGRQVALKVGLLHDLGWSALLDTELEAAAKLLEEGMALIRSQRVARPYRAAFLVALSTLDRLRGQFNLAEQRANDAITLATKGSIDELYGQLALATVLRFSGQELKAIRHYYRAQVLTADPQLLADIECQKSLLRLGGTKGASQQVGFNSLSLGMQWRLALNVCQTTETDIRHIPAPMLAQCLAVLAKDLNSTELNLNTLPDMVRFHVLDELVGLSKIKYDKQATVRAITRGRLGLEVMGQFKPIYGEGKVIELLTCLILKGAMSSEALSNLVLDVSNEVTEPKEREKRLYGQLRYHLAQLRDMIGDRQSIVLSRKTVSLSANWHWSTDLKDEHIQPLCLKDLPSWLQD